MRSSSRKPWHGAACGLTLALLFAGGVFIYGGAERGLEFLTGYIIEWSLSVDNIFVFLLIFSYFAVPAKYQHKVLFWGILGALVMRAIMIALGATLIKEFHWVIYFFGALLVFSGVKMATQKETGLHPEKNPLVRLFRRFMPVTSEYHGDRFFTRVNGLRYATPLFIALLMIESADLVFAVDSVPAIFSITSDPFIVYTSNVFAILGLRSLYFALSGVMSRFHYLKMGLSLVLVFVGVKMLITDLYKVPILVSLIVITGTLTASIIYSLLKPRQEHDDELTTPVENRSPTAPSAL